jgi:hypothetical protein
VKRFFAGAAVLVVVFALCFGIWARLLAGGPVSFIPGGWIRGEVVDEPIDDWSFAAGSQYLLVESRARFLPYSSRVWFMVSDAKLYLLLPSLIGVGFQERLAENADLRVGIEGRVYLQRAVKVASDALVGELMAPVVRRLMATEIVGAVRRVPGVSKLEGASMMIYVLENR